MTLKHPYGYRRDTRLRESSPGLDACADSAHIVRMPTRRLTLELSDNVMDRVGAIRLRVGAASKAEVFRRALAVYDLVTDRVDRGDRLFARSKDGVEVELLVTM